MLLQLLSAGTNDASRGELFNFVACNDAERLHRLRGVPYTDTHARARSRSVGVQVTLSSSPLPPARGRSVSRRWFIGFRCGSYFEMFVTVQDAPVDQGSSQGTIHEPVTCTATLHLRSNLSSMSMGI